MKSTMPFQNEWIQTLTNLGLTLCQAKIYLTIIESGMVTARTISSISKVSQPDIYRIMPKLQKLGLIEKVITTPIKFKPIPIQDAIYILLERKVKETSKLRVKARELVEHYNKETAKTIPKENNSGFILIPEKRAQIARNIMKILETTQTSISCAIPSKRYLQAMTTYAKEIRKTLKRGVEIRIVTGKTEDKVELAHIRKIAQAFKKYPSFKVRHSHMPIKTSFWVRDNKELEIFISPTYEQNKAPALWSKNPSLLGLVQDYFETIWIRGLEDIHEEN